jgi:quercetin dioxygenase-like cupin family protein
MPGIQQFGEKMHIVRGRRGPSELRSGTFTGEVWGDPVLPEVDGVLINSVFFGAGARTNWHTHGRGQVLIVTSGAGLVYDRDGQGGEIATGDIVFIPGGVEHWHGAAADSYLVHLAISIDGHEWLEPVADEDYLAAG